MTESAFRLPTPIVDAVAIHCPACSATLHAFVPQGHPEIADLPAEPWLRDSDAIPRLPIDGALLEGVGANLWVGQCLSCRTSYWVAEAVVVPGGFDDLIDYMSGFGHFVEEMIEIEAILAGEFDAHVPWVEERTSTPIGPVHTHLFGPIPLSAEDRGTVVGANGVSACGRSVPGTPWAKAGEMIAAALPTILQRHAQHVAENA